MKEQIKKRLIALILLILFTIPTAFSAQLNMKQITVNSGIKVQIDGSQRVLTDANGKIVEAFEYNGTTYVPLRAIAQNLGCGVGYDEKAKMAIVVAGYNNPGFLCLAAQQLTSVYYGIDMATMMIVDEDYNVKLSDAQQYADYYGGIYEDACANIDLIGSYYPKQYIEEAKNHVKLELENYDKLIDAWYGGNKLLALEYASAIATHFGNADEATLYAINLSTN